MNYIIVLLFGFICSLIAAFFLFGIAFNTSFPELRSKFLPVYFGIVGLSFLVSLAAPERRPWSLFSTLAMPLALILFIANQKSEFLLDAFVILAVCLTLSFSADRIRKNRIESEP